MGCNEYQFKLALAIPSGRINVKHTIIKSFLSRSVVILIKLKPCNNHSALLKERESYRPGRII